MGTSNKKARMRRVFDGSDDSSDDSNDQRLTSSMCLQQDSRNPEPSTPASDFSHSPDSQTDIVPHGTHDQF